MEMLANIDLIDTLYKIERKSKFMDNLFSAWNAKELSPTDRDMYCFSEMMEEIAKLAKSLEEPLTKLLNQAS